MPPFPSSAPFFVLPRPARGALRLALACILAGTAAVMPAQDAPSLSGLKKLTLEELMNVEVMSVSRRPQRLSETASAVQVVTGEDIRRSGASRIPEALRLATNLTVAQVNAREWAISARGFNSNTSNKLLVMIDGRTVYTPLYAGVFWDVQDTFLPDVSQIEVISGPGATLWGANAVNGVIDITTKNAKDTQGVLLEANAGTELRAGGGVRYGGMLAPNVHYRVYGKAFDRDATLLADGRSAGNDWRMQQGGLRIDWEASPADVVTVQGDVYDGEAGQLTLPDIDLGGGNVMGRWIRTLGEASDLQLQLYVDRTHRAIPGSLTQDLTTYDLDWQHRFRAADRHEVVWGAGYRLVDDAIGNSPSLAFLPAEVEQHRFSAFLQDDIALVPDHLHLTVGTKLEHNAYTGMEYQPGVRLAWRPRRDHTAWAALSHAVRTPSRIDRDLFSPGTPPFTGVQGGPAFRSERLIAYEAGYRAQLTPRLTFSTAGYYNFYDDLRSIEQPGGPGTFPVTIGNSLAATSYGAELTADYRLTDTWRLRAGYSRLIIQLSRQPGSLDYSGGSSESQDADNQFSVSTSWDLTPALAFDATLRHVGAIANQQLPAYNELELRVGWQPTATLELSVVGQNLLDPSHPEFGQAPSRQEIERSLFARATWRY